jgi:putative transposase
VSLPRSSYYRADRPQDTKARTEFRAAVEAVCLDWPAYGYRRVTHELRRRGWHVNHKRVSRMMREEALTVRQVKRFLATTDSDHDEPIFPNLAREFQPSGPNQLWVADITYIRLRSEFVFLAVILDAWSRKVVGYAVSKLLDTRLPLAALEAALAARSPKPGLIHHSDRGCQYASRQYRERLATAGVRGSMSRRANPYDNAQAESFMKTLKHEEVLACNYETMQDVVDRIPRFMEEIYNRRRLHSALGYLPPEEFETIQTPCAA